MIRWTFIFEEGSVKSENCTDEEDKRIDLIVRNQCDKWLILNTDTTELHINLTHVKVVSREVINESIEISADKVEDIEQSSV